MQVLYARKKMIEAVVADDRACGNSTPYPRRRMISGLFAKETRECRPPPLPLTKQKIY